MTNLLAVIYTSFQSYWDNEQKIKEELTVVAREHQIKDMQIEICDIISNNPNVMNVEVFKDDELISELKIQVQEKETVH